MWEHPTRVYNMLKKMRWKTKDEDLKKFLDSFPQANENIEEEKSVEGKKANERWGNCQ